MVFRNNYDYDEQAVTPNRVVLEQEGIFLNYVNYADIRYGGGKVTVNGIPDVYNPIHMVEARPTVAFSTIRYSADAAMSADPNSLLESTFHDRFGESVFAADYNRVGPDLHGNKLVSNSLNALFLRVSTAAASSIEQLEVSARFDDADVVLAIPENLIITGDAGGAVAVTGTCPLTADGRNQLVVPSHYGDFADRQYFSINDGVKTVRFEFDLVGNGVATGSVRIALTLASQDPADVAQIIAAAINGVANFKVTATAVGGSVLLEGTNVDVRGLSGIQARMAGRLSIDPGAVVKLGGSRIETGVGAQFIAEGIDGYDIIFTSLQDDTYGAGGTFDTSNNGHNQSPAEGDWGGLVLRPGLAGEHRPGPRLLRRRQHLDRRRLRLLRPRRNPSGDRPRDEHPLRERHGAHGRKPQRPRNDHRSGRDLRRSSRSRSLRATPSSTTRPRSSRSTSTR